MKILKKRQLKNRRPPKIAERTLFYMLNRNERDSVIGDFEEFFSEIKN